MDAVEKYSVCYIRVSTSDQIDGFSLDTQIETCLKRSQELGYTNVKEFADEGISGKSAENRPGLQEMLNFISNRQSKISAIFIYSYSRLNRNTLEFLTIKHLLSKHGVSLISVTEPSQESPEGDFVRTILSAVAEMENQIRARTVKNNMHKRYLSGYVNGNPPIGYMLASVNGKSSQVQNPESYEFVKKTWHRIAEEHLSLDQVAKIWNTQGLKTHEKRFKRWSKQSLSKVFSNKFYIGYLQSRTYPEEPRGIHSPMISEEVFNSVRYIISGKKPDNTERRSQWNEEFPLKGIIRCEKCSDLGTDRKSTGAFSRGKNGRFAYYSCSSRGIHQISSYPRKRVEDAFLEILRKVKPSPGTVNLFMAMLKEKYHAKIDMFNDSGKTVRKDIQELESILSTLAYKHLKGIYSDDEYLKIKQELTHQIIVKRGIIGENKIDVLDLRTILNFMEYYLTHLDECFLKASLEGKLAIACSVFPSGLLFDKTTYRTPEIGYGYNLNAILQSFSQTKHARISLVQTLNSFKKTYSGISPFVILPT